MRLDINYKEQNLKNIHIWRLNNAFLNNQQVTEEIKREIKKQTMKTQLKTYGMQKKQF